MTSFLLVALILTRTPSLGDPGGPAAIHRTVRFEQQVAARSAGGRGSLAAVRLHVALPATDHRQTVLSLAFEPPPDREIRDEFGQRIAVWERPLLAAGERLEVAWTADVVLRGHVENPDPARLGRIGAEPFEIRRLYLADGDKYSLDHPAVRRAAVLAARGESHPLRLAARINDFVGRQLSYERDGRWDSAPVVLARGTGSCSEYAFLFIALCRASGLPARHAGGTVERGRDPMYEDTVHHRACEVWLAGHGWFPVDPSRTDGGDGLPPTPFFGRIDAQWLIVSRGDGGRAAPLEWDYTSALRARRLGDAEVETARRFVWTGVAPPASDATGG